MKRIVFLDYVRVFACFLVIVVHASENFYGAAGSTDMAGPQSFLANESDRLWVSIYDGFSRMAVPFITVKIIPAVLPVFSNNKGIFFDTADSFSEFFHK